MKLPLFVLAAALLAPAMVSAQQISVDDDGSLSLHDPNSGGFTGIAAPGSLSTDFNSNNGFAGNMIDIAPAFDMQISGIDVNVDGAGLQVDVDVWYIADTSFGNESNATGWTFIGNFSGTSAGADLPSFVDMAGNGVIFSGGKTYGLYFDITSYSTTPINYTNGNLQGNASGNDEWSNADLTIVANAGKGQGISGSTFYPRNWNGCIYYDTGGLSLAVSSLQSGAKTTVSTSGAVPGSVVIVAYSFTGGGPTNTPFGVADLSMPIRQLPPASADQAGQTSEVYTIPPGAAGRKIYVQAVNVTGPGSGVFSNQINGVIL
ncbi:MAG: hypothetical protein MK209_00705 [Planctomycetes bacterium]|nr:hypothetical protein [Planctomycetota bacterium]